jgi:MoaD family protein
MVTSANLSVTVLFFATARLATGTSRTSFEATPGTTVAELAEALVARYGNGLADVMASCALWVNGEPTDPGYMLATGDEVAVLPPVSGG